MSNINSKKRTDNWAAKLAEENGCSKFWVYVLSRRLGRRATKRDLEISKVYGRGRPLKIEGERYPNKVK